MVSVLCIAGLDPSGHAGLSADMGALDFLGIRPMPVASVLTVQNSQSFSEYQPVPHELIGKQIAAVLVDGNIGAAKLGMLGTAEAASFIVDALSKAGLPIIADPVLGSSTGFSLADHELLDAYKHDVFPAASIVTPNAHEAGLITGMEVTDPESAKIACRIIHDLGPEAVLVKGGHFTSGTGIDILYDGVEYHELEAQEISVDARGTGCTLSSLIAGHIALGRDMLHAVKSARRDFTRAIALSQHGKTASIKGTLGQERAGIWHSVNSAASEIIGVMPIDLVAEVGNNLAYALPGARGPEDICSLDSRLLAKGNRVVTLGMPVFGRKSHVGRVVLAAMSHDPGMRCAMNLRYSSELIGQLEKSGFSLGCFDRSGQPEESSSMEWGTGDAITSLGFVPDAVFDRGGIGKEPMVRLLARDPVELLAKLRRIVDIQDNGTEAGQ